MNGMALKFEIKELKKRYKYAFNRLKEFMSEEKEHYKGLKEIINRLLTSRELDFAVGGYENPNGYINILKDSNSPLKRMEFINFFIGHEILDDGIPGIGWRKFNIKDACFEDCNKKSKGAMPYFHNYVDILPDRECLTKENILWVLDWYEQREKERAKFFSEEIEPENPIFLNLVKELGGGI